MALVIADRVQETTTTTGTGTVTLLGAVSGFQTFAAIGNGNTTYYNISGGVEWEVGIGTYTSSGTTLSRTTVLASSNSGSLVNFSAGTKNVFVTYPAEKSVNFDVNNNVLLSSTGALAIPAGTTAQRPSSLVNGMIRVNTTANTFELYSTNTSSWVTVTSLAAAPTSVEYLVVAGGGAGGSTSNGAGEGGGGAGGYRTATGFSVTAGTPITVTVGAGGTAVVGAPTNGSDSVFSTITSTGGGRGGSTNGSAASTGGSGGGGNYAGTGAAGNTPSTTPSQGSAGGNGVNTNPFPAGGGGGASAAGSNGSGSVGGAGGAGSANSISGSSVTYSGGGGGGSRTTGGAGGAGGGGAGGGGSNIAGTAGTVNTGGGGGGAAETSGTVLGGNGGSGIVIIRYADTYAAATATTGSPTITVAGGYRVYQWTASGSITF